MTPLFLLLYLPTIILLFSFTYPRQTFVRGALIPSSNQASALSSFFSLSPSLHKLSDYILYELSMAFEKKGGKGLRRAYRQTHFQTQA